MYEKIYNFSIGWWCNEEKILNVFSDDINCIYDNYISDITGLLNHKDFNSENKCLYIKYIKDNNVNASIAIEMVNASLENYDYSEELEELITNANGTVSFNIVIKDNISDEDKLAKLSKDLNKTFKSSQDVINYIVDSLASAKGYEQIYALEDLGVVKINEINKENYQAYDSVVLLGESSGDDIKAKFNEKEKIIIDKLKEGNKYLVAVSQSNSENTTLELYSKNNVSTIDNINEGIGKVSLVNLLKNQNIVGNYGTSKNAKELIAYDNN